MSVKWSGCRCVSTTASRSNAVALRCKFATTPDPQSSRMRPPSAPTRYPGHAPPAGGYGLHLPSTVSFMPVISRPHAPHARGPGGDGHQHVERSGRTLGDRVDGQEAHDRAVDGFGYLLPEFLIAQVRFIVGMRDVRGLHKH